MRRGNGTFEKRLSTAIPEELKTSLPTIEELEAELAGEEQSQGKVEVTGKE